MRRFFVKNLLFAIGVNVLVKPAYILLIDRTVQVRVGHESFGRYQALMNLSLVFLVLLDFGISNYNARAIARDPLSLSQRFPALLSARLLLSVVYVGVVMIAALVLGYRGVMLGLLGSVLLIQTTSYTLQFIRSCISGLHKFRADALLSVLDRLLMLAVCGALLLFLPQFNIAWFIGAQILCYFIALVVSLFLLLKSTDVSLKLTTHTGAVFQAVKESGAFALLTFLMSFYLRIDTLLIERLCGPQGAEQAGAYAAAYRLLDVCYMFGLTFATMLVPLFGRMLAQGQNVRPIVVTSVNLMLPIALMVAVAAYFFGSDIMHLLYPNSGAYEGQLFAWLMASFPAICLINVYSSLLTAHGNMKLMNQVAAICCVISLGLNLWWIPQHQALGAARVTFITQWSAALGFLFLAKRMTQLPFRIYWLGSYAVYLLVLIAASVAAINWLDGWMQQLSVLALTGFLAVFALRFVSVSSLRKLVTKP